MSGTLFQRLVRALDAGENFTITPDDWQNLDPDWRSQIYDMTSIDNETHGYASDDEDDGSPESSSQ